MSHYSNDAIVNAHMLQAQARHVDMLGAQTQLAYNLSIESPSETTQEFYSARVTAWLKELDAFHAGMKSEIEVLVNGTGFLSSFEFLWQQHAPADWSIESPAAKSYFRALMLNQVIILPEKGDVSKSITVSIYPSPYQGYKG